MSVERKRELVDLFETMLEASDSTRAYKMFKTVFESNLTANQMQIYSRKLRVLCLHCLLNWKC